VADKIAEIDGSGDYLTTLYGQNIFTKLIFPDEIRDYPTLCVTSGTERIVYQPGNIKERYLTITVRVYVNNRDDPHIELDKILEDIETAIDGTNKLQFEDRQGNTQTIQNVEVRAVLTDEGALAPLAVGEMVLEVLY
tara:strand:+ start:876 stop:1286 length:411 start_codon:yes stop_codon:yes gene_type:complete